MEAINAAKESVDRNVRARPGINQPGLKKLSKKTPSTSSGGSSTKGNDIKAKNFYEWMNQEHLESVGKNPTSLREARNKYKTEKVADQLKKYSPTKIMKENIESAPKDDLDFAEDKKFNDSDNLFEVDESAIDLKL